MKGFVEASDEQSKTLKLCLDNGGEFTFDNLILPEPCNPRVTDMLMYKEDGKYNVVINNCVTSETSNLDFNQFIKNGGRAFDTFDDMMTFFRSLKDIFVNTFSNCSDEYAERMNALLDQVKDLVEVNNKRRFSKPLRIVCLNMNPDTLISIADRLKSYLSARYDHDYGVIRFEGTPFAGKNTVHHMYDVDRYTRGIGQINLLNKVRYNPYNVIVVDNIEKLNDKTRSLLLSGANRGTISLKSDFRPINMTHCILLLGTGACVDKKKYITASSYERVQMCRSALSEKVGNSVIAKELSDYVVF